MASGPSHGVAPVASHGVPPGASKAQWRRALLAARRAVPASVRTAEAAGLARHAVRLATELAGGPVCAYLPVDIEPGSRHMLDALTAAGHEVLLPIVVAGSRPGTPAPLDWARYGGPAALADGPWGLRQPTGAVLGVDAIGSASLVLVPALAVDRRGIRLGRGGGFYDMTLPLVGADAWVIAVVRDSELVEALPAQAHDVPVTGALTPGLGTVRLPRN
jgi:5-formyltetrahydrofolate cyclo-ligase